MIPRTEAGKTLLIDFDWMNQPPLAEILAIEDEAAMLEARGMQMLIGLNEPKNVPWKTVTAAAEMVRRTLFREDRRMLRQLLAALPKSVLKYNGRHVAELPVR